MSASERTAGGRRPVFPSSEGKLWTRTIYQNSRRRFYDPAAKAAGVERPRHYDLRHSFVSLLIHQGLSVVEIARQAGHSPQMALSTYAHVLDELDPEQRLLAEEQIRRARGDEKVSRFVYSFAPGKGA